MHNITAISADQMAYGMLQNVNGLLGDARINVIISDLWLVVCIVVSIVMAVVVFKYIKFKKDAMKEQNRLLREMKDAIVNGATANADKLATIACNMKPARASRKKATEKAAEPKVED